MIDQEEWLDMRSRYQNGMSISEIARSTGHDCDEDHRLPVVNSPRCGVCGYTGTAW